MFTGLNEFAEDVKKELGAVMPECEVMVNDVVKNNGIMFKSVVVHRKGSRMSPQIYLEGFYKKYQNGMEMKRICTEIADIYRQNEGVADCMDISQLIGFEKIKDKICFRLVNAEKNQALLQTMPHRKMLDLAVIYCIAADVGEDLNGSIRITGELMKGWGITEQALYELAAVNTSAYSRGVVKPLDSVVYEILTDKADDSITYKNDGFDITLDESGFHFYVATNTKKQYGASVLLYQGLLKQIGDCIGDFYILPSSVHELLIKKAEDTVSPDELLQMVREVNATEVMPEEVLSDNVYLYDVESGELRLITE